ncbi:ankyrin repeat domain-containing protein [Kineosporia sp. A_224]|uniref:ankyrin repeat domain-containing protein n=1 Tax=Kineosporia sp. A_224 TaxID=1962180 RepID=UPI000B4C1312|nr:ankyrin repeat domain-containing protein [Kineosporia sp. A_224]
MTQRPGRRGLSTGVVVAVAVAVGAGALVSSGALGPDDDPRGAASPTAPPASSAAAAGSPTTAPAATSRADLDLIAAATAGDTAAVRAALAAGADVRAVDPTGATALVRAAYGNHVEAARALVDAGADVNHEDSTQQSAYLIATSEIGDDVRLLDLTLAHGGDVRALDSFDGTGLIRAAHRGYPQVVDRLLAAGVAVDHVNNLGWTALLEAVILGDGGPQHQAVVRSILAAGADRGIRDRGGRTALDHAREKGQTEVVRLLEAG